jgi:hypothetical protein
MTSKRAVAAIVRESFTAPRDPIAHFRSGSRLPLRPRTHGRPVTTTISWRATQKSLKRKKEKFATHHRRSHSGHSLACLPTPAPKWLNFDEAPSRTSGPSTGGKHANGVRSLARTRAGRSLSFTYYSGRSRITVRCREEASSPSGDMAGPRTQYAASRLHAKDNLKKARLTINPPHALSARVG